MEINTDNFNNSISNKANTPSWFTDLTRTLNTRGVSISDWNTFVQALKYTVSDVSALINFCNEIANVLRDFKANTNDIADGAVTSVKLEDSSVTSAKIEDGAVNSSKISDYAIEDNHLSTDLKNHLKTVENIAKGASQAMAFDNYTAALRTFHQADKDKYRTGQSVYIGTLHVPDLWISGISTVSSQNQDYYNRDDLVLEDLEKNGYILAGYYYLRTLETLKQDLSNYPTKDELEDIVNEIASKFPYAEQEEF